MPLEEQVARLINTVEDQRDEIRALRDEVRRLGDEVRPRLLRRRDVAAMLGMTLDSLRQHLHRGARGQSELGATLLRLARVGLDGGQCWAPSDLAAHCRPRTRHESGHDDEG